MSTMIAEIEMGHLNTIHHQRAIKKLLINLENLFDKGLFPYEVLPEADIDPGNSESKCPDLQFLDNENLTVPVIIEIATTQGWRSDLRKLRQLIEGTDFGIVEGFVYDFVRKEWHKYVKNVGEDLKNPSWSEVLKLDMKTVS